MHIWKRAHIWLDRSAGVVLDTTSPYVPTAPCPCLVVLRSSPTCAAPMVG